MIKVNIFNHWAWKEHHLLKQNRSAHSQTAVKTNTDSYAYEFADELCIFSGVSYPLI